MLVNLGLYWQNSKIYLEFLSVIFIVKAVSSESVMMAFFFGINIMSEFDKPFPAIVIRKRKILAAKILTKSLVYAFAIFGILFILLLLVVLGILRQDMVSGSVIPEKTILTVDFNQGYPEIIGDDLFSELAEVKASSFFDLIKAINVAALDNRVKALIANVNDSSMGLAQIQEVRQAIARFKSSGKKAYIYSTGFGSIGGGTSEYYLATAFDEIWMQPNTDLGITGLDIEVPFFKGVFDKIGVTPEFYTRYEYKSAVSSLLNKGFTKEFKAETQRLGNSIFQEMTQGISKSRGISKKEVLKSINNAPLFAEEALKVKLIDNIAYKPELIEKVIEETDGKMMNIIDYSLSFNAGSRKLPTIAFVVLDGVISQGESFDNSISNEAIIGADSVVEQLDEIMRNKNVKALVLRINSPGGSYTASNEIWYAVKQVKEKSNIPVIISQANYAASGGYFISIAGDYIFAEPSTITGSIGVLGGKMVLSGLWKKLDIKWGEVKFGDNAGILSVNHKFSEAEKVVFNKSLDRIYKDFTTKVAEARKIDLKDLDKLARGRVWTGVDAKKVGLIDGIGGIDEAISMAKEKGGIAHKTKFEIAYYPKKKSLSEKLSQLISGGPKISVNKVMNDLGMESNDINMLKRMKYDAVLPPFKMSY